MWRALFLIVAYSLTPALSAAQVIDRETEPADVLVVVNQIAADIESIRAYMGKPPASLKHFIVKQAYPAHDFYQAQTMYRKTNRLAVEVSDAARQSPPSAPEHEVLSQDVLELVQRTQAQVVRIHQSIGIKSTTAVAQKRNPRVRAKDVFEKILRVNRQVNLMIDDPFRSSDVYSQLSLANVYLAGVLKNKGLEQFPAITLAPNKQPIDVYEKLIDCLVLNQEIGEQLNVATLKINARRLKRNHAIQSDNYDIATMLLHDVASWTAVLAPNDYVFPKNESPRHVYPAHVFALASAVENQLQLVKHSEGL